MRTKKELLELLLEEWEKSKTWNGENKYSGLCQVIHYISVLNKEEREFLQNVIRAELIKMYKVAYLFPSFLHQPRVEWLKKQIELYDKQ